MPASRWPDRVQPLLEKLPGGLRNMKYARNKKNGHEKKKGDEGVEEITNIGQWPSKPEWQRSIML